MKREVSTGISRAEEVSAQEAREVLLEAILATSLLVVQKHLVESFHRHTLELNAFLKGIKSLSIDFSILKYDVDGNVIDVSKFIKECFQGLHILRFKMMYTEIKWVRLAL